MYSIIKKEIIFAKYSIKKNIESALELRGSFLITIFGMALNNSSFLVIWMSFGVIAKGLGGWQPQDILGMLGFGTIGFGLCFAFFGGVRELPEIVSGGIFDKFLLSPKNVLIRLSTSYLEASALGDMLFGVISLSLWLYLADVTFLGYVFAFIFCICAGLIYFFFSVFVNSASFYFHDARSIVQSLFEFIITPSIFHGGAFQGILRFTFVFIVPALLLGTYPVEAIKNLDFGKLFLCVLLTFLWGVFSIWFFYKSVRKYESSNFINFG